MSVPEYSNGFLAGTGASAYTMRGHFYVPLGIERILLRVVTEETILKEDDFTVVRHVKVSRE